MFHSPEKGSPRSTNQSLAAQYKLPDLAPRLPFAPGKESSLLFIYFNQLANTQYIFLVSVQFGL